MNEQQKPAVPRRVLGTLLNSIGSGVVPRTGLEYVAIGRTAEIEAVTRDLELIEEGGGACRFIIGRYGSGKSFLLQLIRSHCLERGFVCADADLSPDHKLCGSKGQGMATYRRLAANLATRAAPDGGAVIPIISKWFANAAAEIAALGYASGSPEFETAMRARIYETTSSLESLVFGFDFATVLERYYCAWAAGDEQGRADAVRWLRGEFTTKAAARAALGVGSIIDDMNWYDFVTLLAAFVRKVGYSGLVVFIDECVNLYKTPSRISRDNNYEKILAMFNDTLQGRSPGLGIYFGGTPQFLEDPRRGLYSYEALRSRLAEGRYADPRYKNLIGPVIRLERLTDDETLALALRIRGLHAEYHRYEPKLTDGEILGFLKLYFEKVGASSLITPREIIRDLLGILDILLQNPGAKFTEVLGERAPGIKADAAADPDALTADDAEVAFDFEPNEIEV